MDVTISNQQSRLEIDETAVLQAVRAIVSDADIEQGSVDVAIVDDSTIHDLNVRYLDHDYPTDVLSFPLASAAGSLEGQIVVSAEMANQQAPQFAWQPHDELMLYVIHGTLHLVGHDDHAPEDRSLMRQAEDHYLGLCGICLPEARRQSHDAEAEMEQPAPNVKAQAVRPRGELPTATSMEELPGRER